MRAEKGQSTESDAAKPRNRGDALASEPRERRSPGHLQQSNRLPPHRGKRQVPKTEEQSLKNDRIAPREKPAAQRRASAGETGTGAAHRRAMQLSMLSRSAVRRQELDKHASRVEHPAKREMAYRLAERETERDPDGTSKRPAKEIVDREKANARTKKMREIGGVIVRAITATPKGYGNDDDEKDKPSKGKGFTLRPPSGNYRIGGNHRGTAPERTGVAERPANPPQHRDREERRAEAPAAAPAR